MSNLLLKKKFPSYKTKWDRRGRDRMVVGFTTARAITAKVVSSNPTHGEMYSIQHYVSTLVSSISKTKRHYIKEILLKVALHTIILTLTTY